jgi:hypothetical protein
MGSALLRAAVVLGAVLTTFVAANAHAAPCDVLDNGQNNAIPVVYVENGDTQEPLIKRLGKQLIQSGTKVRIIYRNRPTCELATNFYTTRTMATVASRPIRYIPEDPAFDPKTDPPQCDAPASPPALDLSVGATFLSSCTLPAKPANVSVVDGPNQAYGFITNKASGQVAITAEEGYLAFGFTEGTGQASPWIVQNQRFIRGATASTTLTMAAAIALKASQMKAATPSTTSTLLEAAVETSPDPQASLGILGLDLFDQDRSRVKLLAFKGFNQRYAYYPDSTSSSFDKQNVRDGHYLPWAPTPYLYLNDGVGGTTPTSATVQRVVELVFGQRTEVGIDALKSVIDSGLVPQCAMKVKRSSEGGDLSLYASPAPCGCYFDKNVSGGTTSCTACTGDGPCGSGKCRFGYCEVQ